MTPYNAPRALRIAGWRTGVQVGVPLPEAPERGPGPLRRDGWKRMGVGMALEWWGA